MPTFTWLFRFALVSFFLGSSFVLTAPHAEALTVTVKCEPPTPGVYTLGWGTSRLVIPAKGQPYTAFRGKQALVKDRICKSGDNSGAILFRADGTVWAYIRAQNN
jgi:ABC-type multidrug transport system permease subunit